MLRFMKRADFDILNDDAEEDKIVRYRRALFVINALLWISGVSVISVAVYSNIDMKRPNTLVGPVVYYWNNVLLIVSGGVIAVFAPISCIGTCFKKKLTLCSFTYFVTLVFVMQCIVAALSFTWRNEIGFILKAKLHNYVQEEYMPSRRGTAKFHALDDVQTKFFCCGTFNYTDWKTSQWAKDQSRPDAIPASCCKPSVSSADCVLSNIEMIHTRGCIVPVREAYETHFTIMGTISIIVSVFQLICFNLTNYLMFHLE